MRVVIVGGGVAAIEAALALGALARGVTHVELISPDEGAVIRRALSRLRRPGLELTGGRVVAVDALAHRVRLSDGSEREYDRLLIAAGARRRAAVPGALTLWTPGAEGEFEALMIRLGRQRAPRVAIALPAAPCWALPAYELALSLARRLTDPVLTVLTPERAPMEAYGKTAADTVAAVLEQAGIMLRTGVVAQTVAHGALEVDAGESLAVDGVLAAPALEGPAIAGLAPGRTGFIEVDERCAVYDLRDVYAAGDVTATAHKHGALAAHQADVAATAIAADAGAPVEPRVYGPVLRGLLLTGEEPLYLRRDTTGRSRASHQALWWPPVKFPGTYLASYLVSAGRSTEPLMDRDPVEDAAP